MAPVQICVYLVSEEDPRSLGCSPAFTLRLNFPTVARKGSVPQLQRLNCEVPKTPTAVAKIHWCWRMGQWNNITGEVCKCVLPYFFVYFFAIMLYLAVTFFY